MTNYDDDDDDKALQEFLAKKKTANLHSPSSNFNHQSSRNIFASFDASALSKSTSPKKPLTSPTKQNNKDDEDEDEKALQEFLQAKKSKPSPGAFNTQSSRNVLVGFSPVKPKVPTRIPNNDGVGGSDFLAPFTITETPASARKEKEDEDQKALNEFMSKKQSMYEVSSKNTASSRNIFEGLDTSAMLKVGVSSSLRVAPKLTRENSTISQKPRGMLRREGSSLLTNNDGTLSRPPPLLRGNSTMTTAPSAPRRGMLQRENSSFITRKNNEYELSDKPLSDVPTKRGPLQRENSLMMREGSQSVPRARPPLERGMSRNDQGYKQSINQRFLSKMKTKNEGFDDFPDTVSEVSVMSVRSTETALLSDREINEEVGFTHQVEFVQLNHLVSQFMTCGFPVLVFDKLGSIEYLNKEAEDLFGVFSFSALGEHVSELFLDDASVELHQAIYEFLGPTENSTLKADKIGSDQNYLDDIRPYNQISEEEKLERRRALSQLRTLRAKATTIKQFFSVSAKIIPISKLQETHFCIYMRFAQQAENGKYSQMTNSLNQAVTEMITIPVITINDKGIIQVFNKAASSTFGFEAKEVVGRNVKIICNKKDRLKHDSYLEKCKTKDKNTLNMVKKVKGETKSGKIISVEIRVSHILKDGKSSYIAYIRDYKSLCCQAGGFSWIRMDLFWSSVETTKQVYNFASYDTLLTALKLRGLKALFILTYSNTLYTGSASTPPTTDIAIEAFANYSRAAAKHYANENVIFEVYNEADLQGFTPVTYAALSKAAVAAIREGNPNAQVSTTGVAGFSYTFVRGFTSEGGAASKNGSQLFSGIGLHPYGVGSPKSPFGRFPDLTRKFRSIINDNINATLQGKASTLTSAQKSLISTVPPVWDTEWGLTATDFDSNSNGLDEAALRLHANNVVGRLLSSCAVGFPIYIYYDLRNDGVDPTNREHNFGLLFNNYTDKPAMKAVKQLSSIVRNRLFDGYIQIEHPSVTAMRFKSSNDSVIVLLPTETGASVNIKANSASSVVDIFGRNVTVSKDNTFTVKETEGLVYVTFVTPMVTPTVSQPIIQPANSTKVSSAEKLIGNWIILALLLILIIV
ncbi:predicted protein [Naegleria gruberi]|uniref:Predicted protein n=1 Tax=Naegleria gruberi TaxID=5762 RepID=D2W397_NAEGR|nr:uncharacterized protein NAEGRDRAFT_82220 [Naegleria gruberi]EFC36477.1 predicted protein [Naegleria gruberi]|eukprot:XP_002669221.1 predicted protein [Naegleria gruberi strain NEG-M]